MYVKYWISGPDRRWKRSIIIGIALNSLQGGTREYYSRGLYRAHARAPSRCRLLDIISYPSHWSHLHQTFFSKFIYVTLHFLAFCSKPSSCTSEQLSAAIVPFSAFNFPDHRWSGTILARERNFHRVEISLEDRRHRKWDYLWSVPNFPVRLSEKVEPILPGPGGRNIFDLGIIGDHEIRNWNYGWGIGGENPVLPGRRNSVARLYMCVCV